VSAIKANIAHEHQALARQLEDGSYLGSCDWGYCDREQVGWALSDEDSPPEWLSICADCAAGNTPEEMGRGYRVDRFVAFSDLLAPPSVSSGRGE
jgi:hypothetical protein